MGWQQNGTDLPSEEPPVGSIDSGDIYRRDMVARIREILAEKDAEIAELRKQNAELLNLFQQLAGDFEIQGDAKSDARVVSTPAANPNMGATDSALVGEPDNPVETFTPEQVEHAIRSFLSYGEDQYGKSQHGYFSGQGFAGRALRFHLSKFVHDNKLPQISRPDIPPRPPPKVGEPDNPVETFTHEQVEHAIRAYRPNRSLLDISREWRDILVKAIPPRPPPKKG